MSERKVLNKYYPPDYDPSKIPRKKLPKNRQFTIRIMAPFNMRCNMCGEYVYKGKKFNSRQEKAEGMNYLGLHIFRFYIKCPRCLSEITFRTDPETTDYELEAGATRNFEAQRTAELQAKKEAQELEDEEASNPMKLLEKRTKQSQQEMEMIETLEELKELNTRHARVDHDKMIKLNQAYEEHLLRLQQEQEEEELREVFGMAEDGSMIKRLKDADDTGESSSGGKRMKLSTADKPTDILTNDKTEQKAVPKKSFGSKKSSLAGLVKRKTPTAAKTTDSNSSDSSNPTQSTSKDPQSTQNVAHSTANNSSNTPNVPSNTLKRQSDTSTAQPNTSNAQSNTSTAQPNTANAQPNASIAKPKTSNAQSDALTISTNSESHKTGSDNSSTPDTKTQSNPGMSALGLLGNYSDSATDSE